MGGLPELMAAILLASAVIMIVPGAIKIWLEIAKLCLDIKEKLDARKQEPGAIELPSSEPSMPVE